jgi:hypothetical protein
MRLPSQSTAAELRLLPLSWTKIKLLRQCALAFKRRYIDRAPELASPPAETGIGFHEIAETSDDLETELVRKATLLEEAPAADLRSIVRRVVDRGGLPGFPTDATDIERELELAVTSDGQFVSWNDPRAFFRGKLDQSYLENQGELGVVRDWKTSRTVEDPDDQGRLYAWVYSLRHPELTEIVVEFYFVRFSMRPRRKLYDAGELRATVPGELQAVAQDLERRAAQDDWRPRVSDSCRYCSFVASCPKFQDRVSPFLRIETEEQAREAAEQLAIVSGQKSQLEKALKAWCRINGEVDLGEETLGFVAAPRQTVPDALEAFRWFRAHGVSGEEIWLHLSLGKTAVGKLVTQAIAGVSRNERRDARERMEAELLKAGVLEESTGATFKRRGKKVEAEEDDSEITD